MVPYVVVLVTLVSWLGLAEGADGGRPRLYLEIIEPALEPGERSLCDPRVRFEVLVSHEEEGLCGAFFSLSVLDGAGAYLRPIDFRLAIDPVWERTTAGCPLIDSSICLDTALPGHLYLFLDCFSPWTQLPPSDASPIGELSFRLPAGFEGPFQVIVDDPAFFRPIPLPDDSPGVIFVGPRVVLDIELSPSPLLEYRPVFLRGDPNDDGTMDISDPIKVFQFLFLEPAEIRCLDAADANDDGVVDISDGIYVLQFLFRQGSAPSAPYPDPGPDPSEDALSCDGCSPASRG